MSGVILVPRPPGHLGEALVRGCAPPAARSAASICSRRRTPQRRRDDRRSGRSSSAAWTVVAVLHAATLHRPHVATRSRQAFVDTSITGTLNLLESAVRGACAVHLHQHDERVRRRARAAAGAPSAWITEAVVPVPKNIYGATKVAAEDLCALAHRNQGLACLHPAALAVLPGDRRRSDRRPPRTRNETSRPTSTSTGASTSRNVVDAHLCALERADALGFGRYIISATTPLRPAAWPSAARRPPAIVRRRVPGWEAAYGGSAGAWRPRSIGSTTTRAREALGWRPRRLRRRGRARAQPAGGEIPQPARARDRRQGYHPDARGEPPAAPAAGGIAAPIRDIRDPCA